MSKENEKKERIARLNALKEQINKGAKSEIVQVMSGKPTPLPCISTGSILVDEAIGIGGIPQGRIIEIYGPESSGKTTLTLHIAAQAQKLGMNVAFIDAEHALDLNYASNLGVQTDELLLAQPDYGDQAFQIADLLIESKEVGLIIVDSVAALTPKEELEGEMEDKQMGLQARMMSKGLRKITAKAKQNNVTVIFINQLRMKIGVMFGSPETTTGGNALKFYASLRMDIRQTSGAGHTADNPTKNIKVKIVKNKVAPPFKVVEMPITFGKGIDISLEAYELAKQFNLIEITGGTHKYAGTKTIKLSKPLLVGKDEVNVVENGVKFAGKRSDAEDLFRNDAVFAKAIKEEVLAIMKKIKEEK